MEKLTEEAKEYESHFPIIEDLIENGYLRRDIIAALNQCGKTNSFEEGDDVILFIQGILWERKRQKKLMSKKRYKK